MGNSFLGEKEYRYIDSEIKEIRADDAKLTLTGYAAVFDVWTTIYGAFKEKIERGAFTKTIQEADVRALFNHDPNIVLARTKNKTLRLSEDMTGLLSDIDINEKDPDGIKVLEKVKRGDVSQMSFAFKTVKEQWDKEYKERIIQEVKLYDVSPVTYPAYPQTSIKARSLLMENGINIDAISGIVFRLEKGAKLENEEKSIIQSAINILNSYVTEPENIHSEHEPENIHSSVNDVSILRMKLELRLKESNLR